MEESDDQKDDTADMVAMSLIEENNSSVAYVNSDSEELSKDSVTYEINDTDEILIERDEIYVQYSEEPSTNDKMSNEDSYGISKRDKDIYIDSRNNVKDEDIFSNEDSGDISKDDEEIYIATSPAFDPIQPDKNLFESKMHLGDGNNEEISPSKCDESAFSLRNDIPTFTSDIEHIPIKTSDAYSVVNSVDGQNYFITSDISQLNNLVQDNSKAYLYVLSPINNTQSNQQARNENTKISNVLINGCSKEKFSVDEGDTLLSEDGVKDGPPSPVIQFTVNKDDLIGLDQTDCSLNDLNRDNMEVMRPRNEADQISSDFNEFIDTSSKSPVKGSPQVVWHHLALKEVEIIEVCVLMI